MIRLKLKQMEAYMNLKLKQKHQSKTLKVKVYTFTKIIDLGTYFNKHELDKDKSYLNAKALEKYPEVFKQAIKPPEMKKKFSQEELKRIFSMEWNDNDTDESIECIWFDQ